MTSPFETPQIQGCKLCNHVVKVNNQGQLQMYCNCPNVRGSKQSITIVDARRLNGPCGIEARFLEFPGLEM